MKFQLTSDQAKALGLALRDAISSDKIRFHLTNVEIALFEDHVTFTATDSYRCHRVSIETPVTEWGIDPVLVSGVEFVKGLAALAKIAKFREISFSYDYGYTATLAVGDDSHVLSVSNASFPPCDGFLSATSDLEGNALFNGDYFADLMTAAASVANMGQKASDPRSVEIVTINPRKCAKVQATSDDGKVSFTGVIMPARG